MLGLVTLGISDNPLVMYREYIQNSVDALAKSGYGKGGRVEVLIDRQHRRVRIRDNGPGLSYQKCIENLIPVGRSKKLAGEDRGFRGIGRLSGLAFADSVTFLTRVRSIDTVTRVVWPGVALQEWSATTTITDKVVQQSVTVDSVCGAQFPDHFFEVCIDGIARHAAGLVLNRDEVKAYVGEVCPVPMAPSFPFAKEICEALGASHAPYVQDVFVDDDPEPVQRQYGSNIRFSENRQDQYIELEPVRIPSMDGEGHAAVGWVAHASYLGAIPKASRIRGIRARVGNIQIGDERVFDHLFTDDRFNRWCVGEVHVIDDRIVPNARRDYFEPGPHLRHLENYLSSVAQEIALRCRSASAVRNQTKRTLEGLSKLQETYDLVASGYLAVQDADILKCKALESVDKLRRDDGSVVLSEEFASRIDNLEMALNTLNNEGHPPWLNGVPASDAHIYQNIFRDIVANSLSPGFAKSLIESILLHAAHGQYDQDA